MLSLHHSSTPVVLLGAAHHAGLAIARSLGCLRVPLFAIEADPLAPVSASRYCAGRYRWNLKTASREDSLAFLKRLAARLGDRPILIPTNDHSALFVVDQRAELASSYLFPGQLAGTSHALVSKRSLFEWATRCAIPTPATFAPRSKEDVLRFLETAQFPVVLKADDGARPWAPSDPGAQPKCIVRDRRELLEQYERMRHSESPNVVFQEYIPGGEDTIWMFNGYFNAASECLFGMTGQKLRQCPAYTGAACLAICRHNEEVYANTLRFMKAVGYQGILDIGYRYDARDGRYKVLDVNPRIGATFRLFVRPDGMDVARALYLDLTGQSISHADSHAEGRKWIVEDCDLVSSLRYFRDRKIGLLDWMRSFRGLEECSFVSLSDPLPALTVLASDVAELWRRTRNGLSRGRSGIEPLRVDAAPSSGVCRGQ